MIGGAPGRRRARVVTLSGFLGAGKTTTLVAAARLLERGGRRVAIVTNDQGSDLVDTRVAAAAGVSVAEVTGGCFCCRFEDLASVIATAVDGGADTVLAEAVGSCTDLTATVVRPLRREYGDRVDIAPVVVVVDPARHASFRRSLALDDSESDLAYLFDRQLADADVAAINKADLFSGAQTEAVRHDLLRRHPHLRVVPYSAVSGAGVAEVLDALDAATSDRAVEVDYDRYAAAEAGLAWLNHSVALAPGATAPIPSARWGTALLSALGSAAERGGWDVGHVKVLIEPAARAAAFTKLSLLAAGEMPVLDVDGGAMTGATAWLNARVSCRPDELDAAVDDAVRTADRAVGATSAAHSRPASFAPAYPAPRHRLPPVPAVSAPG